MKFGYTEPIYPISVVARLLGVCQATLRIWEKKSLIKPARVGKNRLYSQCDIGRLEHIKDLIQGQRINIRGAKSILEKASCWEIKKCKPKQRSVCSVYRIQSKP